MDVSQRSSPASASNNNMLKTMPAKRRPTVEADSDDEPIQRPRTRNRAKVVLQETREQITVEGDGGSDESDASDFPSPSQHNDNDGGEGSQEESPVRIEGDIAEDGNLIPQEDEASADAPAEAQNRHQLRLRKRTPSRVEVLTVISGTLATATKDARVQTRGRKRKAEQSSGQDLDENQGAALLTRQTRHRRATPPPENPTRRSKRQRGRPPTESSIVDIGDSSGEEEDVPAKDNSEEEAGDEAEDEDPSAARDDPEDAVQSQEAIVVDDDDRRDNNFQPASHDRAEKPLKRGRGRPPGSGKAKPKETDKEGKKKGGRRDSFVPPPPITESEKKTIRVRSEIINDMGRLMGLAGWTGQKTWKVAFRQLQDDSESGPLPVTQEGKRLWDLFNTLADRYMKFPFPEFPTAWTFQVYAQYAFQFANRETMDELQARIRQSVTAIYEVELAPLDTGVSRQEANMRALLCEDLLRFVIPQAVALLEVAFMLGGRDEDDDGLLADASEPKYYVPLGICHMTKLNLEITSTMVSWLSRLEAALARELGYRAEYPIYRPELSDERHNNHGVRRLVAAADEANDGDLTANPATRRDARKRLRLLIDRVQDQINTAKVELQREIQFDDIRMRRTRRLLEFARNEQQRELREKMIEVERARREENLLAADYDEIVHAATPARSAIQAVGGGPSRTPRSIAPLQNDKDYSLSSYNLPGLDDAPTSVPQVVQSTAMVTVQDSQEDEDDMFVSQHDWAERPSISPPHSQPTVQAHSSQGDSQPFMSGAIPDSRVPPAPAAPASVPPSSSAQKGGKVRSTKAYSARELGYIMQHLKAHKEPDLVQLASDLGRGIVDVAKRAEVIKNAGRTLAIKRKQPVPPWARAGFTLPL